MKRKANTACIYRILFSGIRSSSSSTRTKRVLIFAAAFLTIVLLLVAFSVLLNGSDLIGSTQFATSSTSYGEGKGSSDSTVKNEPNHLIGGSSSSHRGSHHGSALTIKKSRKSGTGRHDPTTGIEENLPPLVVSESLAARFLNQVGLFYPPHHRDPRSVLDTTNHIESSPSSSSASPFYAANGAHRPIHLPYTYPLHLSLPKDRTAMARSILSQFFEKPPQMDDDVDTDGGDNNRDGHKTVKTKSDDDEEQKEETGDDNAGKNSKTHDIPTAPIESTSNAAQCLRRSREAPVLFLDVEALKIIETEKDRQEAESDAGNENRRVGNSNSGASLSKSLLGAGGGVIRDVKLSEKLEREFGFDNKVLYGKERSVRRKGGRETSSQQSVGDSNPLVPDGDDNRDNKEDEADGGAVRISPLFKVKDASSRYRWDSAIFYRNIASDAHLPNHPNTTVRKAWERSKVRWVAIGDNDANNKDEVRNNNNDEDDKNMMRRVDSAVGMSDSRANEAAEHEVLSEDIDGETEEQWWDYDDEAEDGNLPCTQYVQHRLHALMNPRTCRGDGGRGGGGADAAEISKRSVNNGSDDDNEDNDPFEVRKEEIGSVPKFLISHLKSPNEGFGTGAAISLVAFDLLSATVLNRVLLMKTSSSASSSRVGGGRINTKKWHFASETCAEAGHASWDCFWQFPSRCQYEVDPQVTSHPMKIRSKKEALRNANVISIVKENFDAKGLGRNDVPSDEDFFGKRFVRGLRRRRKRRKPINRKRSGDHKEGSGDLNFPFYTSPPKCYLRFKKWAEKDLSHTYVQGTFSRGADAHLFYMMSQAMRYLLRYQQPWFYNMLAQGLGYVGMGQGVPSAEPFELVLTENMFGGKSDRENYDVARRSAAMANGEKMINRRREDQRKDFHPATLYIHERGEINKFREYYSNFGCHNVKSELLIDLVTTYCLEGVMDRQGGIGDGGQGEEVPENNNNNNGNNGLRFNKDKNGMVYLRDDPKKNTTIASPLDVKTKRYRSACHLFISGNTPSGNYRYLRSKLEAVADGGGEDSSSSLESKEKAMSISSTWNLFEPARPRRIRRGRRRKNVDGNDASSDVKQATSNGSGASASGVETARWGANSPSAGWIDLYAGASSSHWACIVQSNWCRLVNWLRLTSGRAVCGGFADLGTLMLSSPTLRDGYCIVNMSWPTKAFSNRIK